MVHRKTAKLSSWQVWLLTLSGGCLWLSGTAWLLLHYFGQKPGEYGPEMNPLEPWMMKIHGLALIPALLGIGGMFVSHIPKGWTYRAQRIAGVAFSAMLAMLIVSGYSLYYAGDDEFRASASTLHWAAGLLLPIVFIWHYLNGQWLRRSKLPSVNAARRANKN